MKKLCFSLVVIAILLSAIFFADTFAFAEEKATLHPTCVYNGQDYVDFSRPIKELAVSSSYTVALLDSAKVTYIGEEVGELSLTTINAGETFSFEETQLFHLGILDKTLAVSASNHLFAYSLEKGEWSQVVLPETFGEIKDIATDYDNDKLVVTDGRYIKNFALKEGVLSEIEEESFDAQMTGYTVDEILAVGNFTAGENTERRVYFKDNSAPSRDMLYLVNSLLLKCQGDYLVDNQSYYPTAFGIHLFDNGTISFYQNNDFTVQPQKVLETQAEPNDQTLGEISAYCFFEDKIFIADNGYNAIKIFSQSDYSYQKMYGSWGTSQSRLNHPTSLSGNGDLWVVTDSGNKRLIAFQGDTVSITPEVSSSLSAVSTSQEIFHCEKGEKTLHSSSGENYSFDLGISAIYAGDNGIFVACGQSIFVKGNDGKFTSYATADSTVISLTSNGKVLYVLTSEGTSLYHEGEKILSVNQENCIDLLCDYHGNLYLLQSNAIIRFARHLKGFDTREIYPLSVTDAKDFAFACDKIFILSDHRAYTLEKKDIGFSTASAFNPSSEVELPATIIKAKEDLTVYSQPDCFHDISILKQGDKAFVRTTVTYDGQDYLYLETTKGLFYLPKSGLNVDYLSSGEADIKYGKATIGTVSIYPYPSTSAQTIPVVSGLGKEDIIEIIALVALDGKDDAWGWYEVKFGEYQGFIPTSSLSEAVKVEEINRKYYKINVSHLGEHIPVYKSPDHTSEVVHTLYDGKRVEMREEINLNSEYSRIWIDGEACYVKTCYLTNKALTEVQTMALILFAVVFMGGVITALLFFSLKQRKK